MLEVIVLVPSNCLYRFGGRSLNDLVLYDHLSQGLVREDVFSVDKYVSLDVLVTVISAWVENRL